MSVTNFVISAAPPLPLDPAAIVEAFSKVVTPHIRDSELAKGSLEHP